MTTKNTQSEKSDTCIGHVMTVGELMVAQKRAPKSALVLVERSATKKLKPMTVGEAFPHRIYDDKGKVGLRYFKICPTSVSDAMHRRVFGTTKGTKSTKKGRKEPKRRKGRKSIEPLGIGEKYSAA